MDPYDTEVEQHFSAFNAMLADLMERHAGAHVLKDYDFRYSRSGTFDMNLR